jgi:hypothetical protein
MIRRKSAASGAFERRKSITLATAVLDALCFGMQASRRPEQLEARHVFGGTRRNEAFNHSIWIRAQAIEKPGYKPAAA